MTTLRTFRAPDARGALQAVKNALGPDAVIIATREVSGGLFRGREIEVTAAVAATAEEAAAAQEPKAAYGPRKSRAEVAEASDREALKTELSRLRATMEEVRREVREAGGTSPTRGRELREHLVERGVEEALADEVVRQALAEAAGDSSGALMNALRTVLSQKLLPARAPWFPGKRRVLALVGPTGVGKTTTMAKIAARALLESRMKVALITLDTYRIGASEQVTRYGEIMRVPAFVAKDRAQLAKGLERSQDADLILIDTAGRSLSEAVAQQAELLRSVPGVQLHLVLSAATGAKQLAATAERYRILAPERLVFTKLDEAAGPGSILSASARLGSPVCAVADGQRVPEDLHAVSGARLFELVTGTQGGPRRGRMTGEK